jgi:membrane-associated phospholipid phosphatase
VKYGLPDKVRRRLDPAESYGLRLTLFAIALTLVAIPFGLLLHQVMTDGPLTKYDTALAKDLHELVRDSDAASGALHGISFLGKPIWLTFVIGAPALWLFWRGSKRLAIYLVATSITGGIVDTIVKLAVGRPRPVLDEPLAEAFGKSFPSGHSMSSMVCYGALLLAFLPIIPRRGRPLAFAVTGLLIFSIGISRLGLGVHFLSDVLGGFVLGAAWLIAATAAFSIWRVERGRPEVHVTEGVEPEEVPEEVSAST